MRLRQRLDRQRLGQARHAFEQDVAVGQQADEQPVDQVALADDDVADLLAQAVQTRASSLTRSLMAVIPVSISAQPLARRIRPAARGRPERVT